MSYVGNGIQIIEYTSGITPVRNNLGFIVSGSSLSADVTCSDGTEFAIAGAEFNNKQLFPCKVASVNAKNNTTHVLVLTEKRGAI